MHEVSTLRCSRLKNSLHCVSTEVRKLPYYDGLDDVNIFLDQFEKDVPKEHWFQALHLALIAMPTRWWGTCKDNFADWKEYRRMMQLRFRCASNRLTEKYIGKDDLHEHLAQYTKAWGEIPQPEWVHIFIHTLDVMPKNWYLEMELRHGTID